MNKRNKIILMSIIIASIFSSNVLATELQDAQSESNQIQKQIDDGKSKIEDIKKNKNDVLSEINYLDKEVGQAQLEVEQLNLKISNIEKEKSELDAKLQVLQNQLNELKQIINQRFRKMYMSNGDAYIELLFNSKNFSDLIDRVELIKSISNQDKKLIIEFNDKQQQLNDSIKRLENLKSELSSSKEKYDNRLIELRKYKDEKNQLMQKLESDEDVQENILQQQEAEFQKVNEKINVIQEKVRQQEAQQQAQQQQQNRGQSASNLPPVSNGKMFSITGGIRYAITSPYEPSRISPISGKTEKHLAIDIGAPMGSGVYSLMNGVVAYAGWMTGYGNVVIINHGELSTLYAHNSQLLVSEGQTVKGGQQISVVGSTGWSTGPHIHFEVISNGAKINPTGYYF